MPSESSGSAVIRWADPETVREAVEELARRLRDEHPEVRRIYWYGSWVSGAPTPSSDVDLCVVISGDPRRPRERVPDYLPDRFPAAIDLAVLTEDELEDLRERAPGWYRAISSGRML